MRVLHINRSDISGGAALAGYRLHQALLQHDVDSRLLVGQSAIKNDPKIRETPKLNRLDYKLNGLSRSLGLNYTNILSSFSIENDPDYKKSDIINIHNVLGGYFNYLSLSSLAKLKPVVITLHDMWYLTGHCAYSNSCDRWMTGCGHCPDLEAYPAVQRDSTHLEWKIKRWIYNHVKMTVVAPSRWLVAQAQKSILSQYEILHIPYGIDLDNFKPLNRSVCRESLGIPENKFVVLFAAANLEDKRKGFHYLAESIARMSQTIREKMLLLTMGSSNDYQYQDLGIQSLHLGYMAHDRLKAIVYSAANAFVLPTEADNLPLVLQESLACGTPMISFDVGGVPDLVRHNVSGFLVKPGDVHALTNRLIEMVENPINLEKMSVRCRTIATQEFSLSLQAQRYKDLYEKIATTASEA